MGSYNINEFNTSPFVTTSIVGIDFDDEKGFHLIYGDKYAIEVTQSLQETIRDRYSISIVNYENERQVVLKDSTLSSHEVYSTFLNGEIFGIVNKRNINGYRELTFKIPYTIVDTDNNLIDNFRIPYCTEEYKVELYLRGVRDYYVIKEITDGYGDDGLKFREVYCWHYPFAKLSQSGNQLDFEYIDTARNILTDLLDGSDWSVGTVDIFFEDDNPIEKIRTLKANGNTNRYELIQNMAEIFGGFPVFDSEFKRVHFLHDPRIDKGIVFRYGKNIKSYSIISSTKELATKIWIEGGENDLGITYIDDATSNTLGEPYILNFDYFIEKGLINATQQLAITNFETNIGIVNGNIKTVLSDLTTKNDSLLAKETSIEFKITSKTAKEASRTSLINIRNSTTNATTRATLQSQIDSLTAEINALTSEISTLNGEISTLEGEISVLESTYIGYISSKNSEIQTLENSVGDFIREKLYKNENYTDADALYADALNVATLACYPQYDETISVLDLSKLTGYEIEEFDEYTKVKIVVDPLGITSDGQIREIDQVLDDPRLTTCAISTFITSFEDYMSSSFTSTNDLKIMKETYNRSYGLNPDGTVNKDFLQQAFDSATFRLNVTSSSYIDPVQGFISVNLDNPNQLMKLNSAGLAISEDGGQTWELAITIEGLVAEAVKAGSVDTKYVKIYNSDDGDINSGAGFYIDGEGLKAYNSSGVKTVEILNTGDAYFAGDITGATITATDGSIRIDENGINGYKFHSDLGYEVRRVRLNPYYLQFLDKSQTSVGLIQATDIGAFNITSTQTITGGIRERGLQFGENASPEVQLYTYEDDTLLGITYGGSLRLTQNGTYISGGDGVDGTIVYGNFSVTGTKNRLLEVDGNKKYLHAYETPTPYFGDLGSGKTDENGFCKIIIDETFAKTIELKLYKVFIQECGDGKLWVEKHENCFYVKGTPNLDFDYEIKAIQKNYADVRFTK